MLQESQSGGKQRWFYKVRKIHNSVQMYCGSPLPLCLQRPLNGNKSSSETRTAFPGTEYLSVKHTCNLNTHTHVNCIDTCAIMTSNCVNVLCRSSSSSLMSLKTLWYWELVRRNYKYSTRSLISPHVQWPGSRRNIDSSSTWRFIWYHPEVFLWHTPDTTAVFCVHTLIQSHSGPAEVVKDLKSWIWNTDRRVFGVNHTSRWFSEDMIH